MICSNILSINTATKQDSYAAAFQLANEQNIHIVAIQEPNQQFASSANPLKSGTPDPNWNFFYNKPTSRSLIAISSDIALGRIVHFPSEHDDITIVQIGDMFLINVYQAPKFTDAIEMLPQLIAPFIVTHPVIVVGDFNARHIEWDRMTNPLGRALVKTISQLGIHLISQPFVPTFSGLGKRMHQTSTVDLVLINDMAFSLDPIVEVKNEWDIQSDHYPIHVRINSEHSRSEVRQVANWDKANWDGIKAHVEAAFAILKQQPIESEDQINGRAECMQAIYKEAIAQYVPQKRICGRSRSWWTTEIGTLRSLAAYYRRKARSDPSPTNCKQWRLHRKKFQRAIREAKRNQGIAWIENFDETKLWRHVRALKEEIRPKKIPALIIDGNQRAITSTQKMDVLVQKFFGPAMNNDDRSKVLARLKEITRDELRPSVQISDEEIMFQVKAIPKDCATGIDGIPVEIITRSWDSSGPLVCDLVRAAVSLGIHPAILKRGKTIALRKPGRSQAIRAKDYRPITMLSTLSKIIEKVLAARISSHLEPSDRLLAIDFDDEQYGFRSCRGCEQASAKLVDYIRKAKGLGKVASVAFLDIAGAYDTVLPSKLVEIMIDLKLPLEIIQWTLSFLTDRSTSFTVEDVTRQFNLSVGLPQGSPLSPILYAIYNKTAIQILKHHGCEVIAYADDIAVIATGEIEENCVTLQRGISMLKRDWCIPYNQLLAEEKSVVVHFNGSGQRWKLNPKNPGPDLLLEDQSTIKADVTVKHLGLQLDIALNFQDFIQQRVIKLKQIIGALKKLGYQQWGLSRDFRLQTIHAVVIPIITFSAMAWAPFIKLKQLEPLNREFLHGLRWAAGLEPSTPAISVFAESGFMPVFKTLSWTCSRTVNRWRTLRHMQPLVMSKQIPVIDNRKYVLPKPEDRTLVEAIAAKDLLRIPPLGGCNPLAETFIPVKSWEIARPKGLNFIVPASKKAAFEAWQNWQTKYTRSDDLAVIYTDGSKLENGSVGAASVIQGQATTEFKWKLAKSSSIFQAEGFAANHAIAIAAQNYRRLHIMTDSLSIVQALENYNTKPEFITRVLWKTLHTVLSDRCQEITFQWIPSHQGIPGNERADVLAKEAAESNVPPIKIKPSLGTINMATRDLIRTDWSFCCLIGRSINYVPANVPSLASLKRLHSNLSRAESSLISQFRTGHTRLNGSRHHVHFESSNRCVCGAVESSTHFIFDCCLYADLREPLLDQVVKLVGRWRKPSLQLVLDCDLLAKPTAQFLVAAMRRREIFR